MELEGILAGLDLLLSPGALIYLVVGLVAGFVTGVLPGFGSSNATAVALSLSLALPVEQALVLMISIYAGSTYGGSVPAILLNVPGEAGSAATAMDGYPLAQQGKGAMAIGVARLASALGGVISMVIVLAIIAPLSQAALLFGAREMLLVVAFGVVIVAGVVADSPGKGMLSATMGLLLAAMSASPTTGQARFTLGMIELYEGVPIVPALIGLFGFSQMFELAASRSLFTQGGSISTTTTPKGSGLRGFVRRSGEEVGQGFAETLQYPRTIVRSSLLGMIIGVIPGMGASVGNFVGWAAARRASKNPELFGKGAPEGVIGSEAADNGVASGTLVPMLTLGIPGSGTGAVMIAALILHGVAPGPRVMVEFEAEAYAVLLGALVASILILPLGILLAAPITGITRVTPQILVPLILVISAAGVYASRGLMFDVWMTFVFGLLGYAMTRYEYPLVPMVLGLVLGPIGEQYLMRALLLGRGQLSYFFGSPTAIVLWILLVALIVVTVLRVLRKRAAR